MKFKSEKFIFRPFTEEDISDSYLSWLNNKVYMKFSDQRHVEHTKESAASYIKTFHGSENYFLAAIENDQSLVGTVTIYRNLNNNSAFIGILISPDKSGRGFATEIFKILLAHLSVELGLYKITAGTCELNSAMISVLEKSGMELDYRISKEYKLEDKYFDNLVYAKFF